VNPFLVTLLKMANLENKGLVEINCELLDNHLPQLGQRQQWRALPRERRTEPSFSPGGETERERERERRRRGERRRAADGKSRRGANKRANAGGYLPKKMSSPVLQSRLPPGASPPEARPADIPVRGSALRGSVCD